MTSDRKLYRLILAQVEAGKATDIGRCRSGYVEFRLGEVKVAFLDADSIHVRCDGGGDCIGLNRRARRVLRALERQHPESFPPHWSDRAAAALSER